MIPWRTPAPSPVTRRKRCKIIAFGFLDADLATLRDDPDLRERQRARFERMAPHVESTGTDGIYEVIDEVTP
jgi:hypothetical protein